MPIGWNFRDGRIVTASGTRVLARVQRQTLQKRRGRETMHLYIMRHGETFWNKKGLIQGSSDIALTRYGECTELARDARDWIRSGKR
ncbi:MAG: histidine phosphatase family protein [Eubacterium sp.]